MSLAKYMASSASRSRFSGLSAPLELDATPILKETTPSGCFAAQFQFKRGNERTKKNG
jgi:hypothetical protein